MPEMLEIIQHHTVQYDFIHEIRLSRPPVNALDPNLVARLRDAVLAAPANGAQAILLSGQPGIFSAGLDVPELLRLDRRDFRVFWQEFFGLCGALAASPVPIAAAITGHSPAGGAVLAILCDYRVMAKGEYRIGLNEVQVGLLVPECIQAALRRLVGARHADRLLVTGAMLQPEEAAAIGFVDALAEPGGVVATAKGWLEGLLALPPHAVRATRQLARADLAALFAEPEKLPIEDFLDGWFSPPTQAVLRALVARLKSRG